MKRSWQLTRLFLSLFLSGLRVLTGMTVRRWMKKGSEEPYLLTEAAVWARQAVAIGGARVQVTGLEHIPEDRAVLYVANHQGTLDIPILMGYLPGTPAFVAKKELFTIPVLGFWMRRIGCISLDRESPRAALKSMKGAAKEIRTGRRITLFPEGTRSRHPEGQIAPFKRGSLKLATMAGAVVVPVTVEGSRFLLNSSGAKGFDGQVKVVVGEAIEVADLDADGLKELPEAVYRVIDDTRVAIHMGGNDDGESVF